MSGVHAAKKLLRAEVKKRVLAMSTQKILEESDKITRKLLSHEWFQSSQRVAVYLSMSDEVQTSDILHSIFCLNKTCFIPWYDEDSTRMDMLRVTSMQDVLSLPLTRWNVRQPATTSDRDNALDTGGLDLVIVPGLAFTKEGHRLGRGRGYYDTFLERCASPRPRTIALCLSPQLVPSVPTHEHDVRVHVVLSAL